MIVSIGTGTIGVLVACLILLLVRGDRLHISHGMTWVIVAIGFALLGFAPSIIDELASLLGVSYPPVLALTIAIALLVIKILLMDIERSQIEVRNQRLVQRIAMLKAYLKQKSIETSTNASDSQFDNTETLKEASLGESRKRDMG